MGEKRREREQRREEEGRLTMQRVLPKREVYPNISLRDEGELELVPVEFDEFDGMS